MTANKNLGSGVTGYLTPDGRSWETVVTQSAKPLLDREINLWQDLDAGAGQEALRRCMPSGWLSDDFLTTSDPVGAIFASLATADTIEIPNGLRAHVNGWLLDVRDSYVSGSNQLALTAGPPGATAKRTDLVIIEVWRRLISASPSTTGKSATGRIWQNGNVATSPADDLTLNYADDILYAPVGAETSKRVQIQYRLRVVNGVDLFAYPYGINDPVTVANSVPVSAGAPDGVATLFTYSNQSASGDPGLWVAGDGVPTNTLGTVDGYMYALPLLAVFRRNTTAFARATNQNGGIGYSPTTVTISIASPGVVSWAGHGRSIGDRVVFSTSGTLPTGLLPGVSYYITATSFTVNSFTLADSPWGAPINTSGVQSGVHTAFYSDRPDGLFHDIVDATDVIDLRSGVSSTGWSAAELLEKTTNLILDNSLRTEIGSTSNGGGSSGTTLLMENEIGGPAGPPLGGLLVRNFDAVCRRFSDRPILETVTVVIPAPGGGWVDAAAITIDPTALTVYPYSAFNWASFAPSDVQLMDILEWHWTGTANNSQLIDAEPYVASVSGLGALPLTSLGVTFGSITALNLTHGEDLHVKLLIGYPSGSGLTHTPIEDYGADSFVFTTAAPSAAAPISYASMDTQEFDFPHREAQLEYETSAISYVYRSGAAPTATALLPERASAVSSPAGTLDASGRVYTLSVTPAANATVTINYTAVRPMPQVGGSEVQMAIYYRTAAPQMALQARLTSPFSVVPKLVSQQMYSFTSGSGSQDESYPYPTAYVQTGGLLPPPLDESAFSGGANISVADFNASTGMLKLPVYVPMVANPEALIFTGLSADLESRSYFGTVPAGYIPNAYAQDLSFPDRHKNMLPILAELAEDSSLGFKGQLVLVLLLRYAAFDAINGVFFGGTTTASVFRVKGLLLNKRAVS